MKLFIYRGTNIVDALRICDLTVLTSLSEHPISRVKFLQVYPDNLSTIQICKADTASLL